MKTAELVESLKHSNDQLDLIRASMINESISPMLYRFSELGLISHIDNRWRITDAGLAVLEVQDNTRH
jgi:hypothetical protein